MNPEAAPRRTLDEIAQLGDPAPEVAEPGAKDELPGREHAFVLRVRTPKGLLEDTLVCRVRSTEERIRTGRIRARLAGGVPWDLLDYDTRGLVEAQAVVAVALQGTPPPWLDHIIEERPDVLLAIYEEVRAHEARFFRLDARQDGEAPRAPLVEVVPVHGALGSSEDIGWAPGALGAARGAAPPSA